MAIDFPSSPTTGQQYIYNGVTYTFTSQGVWAASPAATKVAFIAYPAGDQSGVVTEVWTKINLGVTQINDSSLFNVSSSRWTPPTGRCQLNACVMATTGLLLGTPLYIGLYKNGAVYRYSVGGVLGPNGGANLSVIDVCSGTDYYEIWCFGYSNTTYTVLGSLAGLYTCFSGATL